MALWLGNADVERVLTMDMTLEALEQSYRELLSGEVTCRPKITLRFPTRDPSHIYNWGTMEGGSCASGYFAIRVKSDVVYKQHSGVTTTREKYCVRPGLFCGLIMLFQIENGEPLAIMNDGVLQHFRVGADSGIGAKYMAKAGAEVVGMLGSGGMARSHMEAFVRVRKVKKLQVYSPTAQHRQSYAREMGERHGLEAVAMNTPRDVFRGADIVAGCTDAQVPVIIGEWVEPGTHITCVGGRWDQATHDRVDVALRLGTAPAPTGLPEWRTEDEGVVYSAFPRGEAWKNHTIMQREYQEKRRDLAIPRKTIYLEDLLARRATGRESDRQITFSERGNVQGAQFFSVAGKVYEKARELGLGHQLPTEWFLQDIRD